MSTAITTDTQEVKVEEIVEGDLVDLASCPYLNGHPSADFQYAEVSHAERETEDCVVLSYEGIDDIGYPIGTILKVVTKTA